MVGLEALSKLVEINLALKKIESVGPGFKHNPLLESVNLSGNPLGSFREISSLCTLRNLKHLSFADPHYCM